MKQNIGIGMLILYYAQVVIQAIVYGQLMWFLGFLLLPMITIPAHIFLNLIFDFWYTLFDVAWIAIAFYLLGSD